MLQQCCVLCIATLARVLPIGIADGTAPREIFHVQMVDLEHYTGEFTQGIHPT